MNITGETLLVPEVVTFSYFFIFFFFSCSSLLSLFSLNFSYYQNAQYKVVQIIPLYYIIISIVVNKEFNWIYQSLLVISHL